MNRSEIIERYETFRDKCQPNLYDFFNAYRPYHLVSCCGWGPPLIESENCLKQEIFFGTRADENCTFNKNTQRWYGGPASLLAVGEVDIPHQGYQIEHSKGRVGMEVGGPHSSTIGAYQ